MKNTTKRTLAASAAAAVLIGAVPFSAYGESVPLEGASETEVSEAAMAQSEPNFNYISATITVGASDEVNTIASDDFLTYLYKSNSTLVLGADGAQKSFNDITEGSVITYYINANAPATLQYPPHYTADVIVIEDADSDVSRTISVFDSEYLSEDGEFYLNLGDNTAFYLTDPSEFTGGKALVFYDMILDSYPAQIAPIAVVKLAEDEEADVVYDFEVVSSRATPDLSKVKEISVGDVVISHIPVTVNGVQMLPVRSYAEALGFEVEWIEETKTVNVGHASFNVNEDSYVMGRTMAQSLGQAPILIALPGESFATTYVPAAFFTEILGATITVDGTAARISIDD